MKYKLCNLGAVWADDNHHDWDKSEKLFFNRSKKISFLPWKQLDWIDELVRFFRRRLRFSNSSLWRLKSACRSCSLHKCTSFDSLPEFISSLL